MGCRMKRSERFVFQLCSGISDKAFGRFVFRLQWDVGWGVWGVLGVRQGAIIRRRAIFRHAQDVRQFNVMPSILSLLDMTSTRQGLKRPRLLDKREDSLLVRFAVDLAPRFIPDQCCAFRAAGETAPEHPAVGPHP